jgi:hypothetical protein
MMPRAQVQLLRQRIASVMADGITITELRRTKPGDRRIAHQPSQGHYGATSDIVDTIERIVHGQCVVIEMIGQRPIINHDTAHDTGIEMPAIDPFKTE